MFVISDIIFLIYLYQRYIYRVDPQRLNEFGTSGDMFDQEGKIKPIDESLKNEDTATQAAITEGSGDDKQENKDANKKPYSPKSKNKKAKKED